MPTYISMLRGVNVTGHNLMKMTALRELFESLGFNDCKTYIQSGNVVFQSAKRSTSEISQQLEEQIAKSFGFRPAVTTRTSVEVAAVIQANPFLKKKGIDLPRLHVTFLSKAPDPAGLKKLELLPAAPDEFRASGREIYLYCPNGYGNTKLNNNNLERLLATSATTRNWNTVNKLHEMAVKCG